MASPEFGVGSKAYVQLRCQAGRRSCVVVVLELWNDLAVVAAPGAMTVTDAGTWAESPETGPRLEED